MKYLGIESFLGHTSLHTHVTSPPLSSFPSNLLVPTTSQIDHPPWSPFLANHPFPHPPTPKSQTLYA